MKNAITIPNVIQLYACINKGDNITILSQKINSTYSNVHAILTALSEHKLVTMQKCGREQIVIKYNEKLQEACIYMVEQLR